MTTDQLNWQKDNFENIQTAWDGDLWDRRRLGEQLTNYVDRLQCGAVLALDARWGEGKTWFVRHWTKHLDNTNHNVIYLDAFVNDYLDDPFLVIASEIAAKLDKTADKKLVHKFKKAAAVMQQGLLTIAPTLIASMISCAITGGVIPFIKIDSEKIADKLDDAIDKVTDNIGEKVTEAIQNKIESYEEEKQSLIAFKQTLAQLAESLDKPLVFIIDELDRCRPDFAIRLIERIKHFFDIPKIVFVLVMDKHQFSTIVSHNYGYNHNGSEEYLTKFIDFTIKLNLPQQSTRLDFIRQKLRDVGIPNNSQQFGRINDLLTFMAQYTNTSTRKLIKIVNELSLLALDTPTRNHILAIYLFLKNELIEKKTTSDIFEYIVQWFVEIVKSDTELHDMYEEIVDGFNRSGRTHTLNHAYAETLNRKREISIQRVFIRYYDRYLEDSSSDYMFSESGIMPFNSYDELNFKKEWENYISTGLSI